MTSSLSPSAESDAPDPTGPELDADLRVPLRLTVTRGLLGLELYEEVELGPLAVAGLSLSLPGLKFPVDLSGGVPRFRQRRGELVHARLRLDLDAFAALLALRAEGVLAGPERRVQVWPLQKGFGVGVRARGRAFAVDVLWAPDGADARFVLCRARGVGLTGPALAEAMRLFDTALGGMWERRGRSFIVRRAAVALGRVLLPAVGARVPSAAGVNFGELEVERDALAVDLDVSFRAPVITPDVVRELELALLVADADEALVQGDLDEARRAYLTALEQAPRHPEIVKLVSEIDVCAGARTEAALGLLVESVPAHQAGVVGAELLAATGDIASARDAMRETVRGEPFAPLSALALRRLAELDADPAERRAALDSAVARAPALAEVREARFEARLAAGDVEGAIADAEHLEAAATGSYARHEVCCRAARRILEQGYLTEAGRLFERALRYLPDDATATAGLARALLEAGRKERAISLLERAIELGERRGRADPDALLDLARVLAEDARDLPQAVARVRQVSAASARHVEARALEARWRSMLGDLAGASLAYGRMREAVELSDRARPEFTPFLLEAATFERLSERDLSAAERHLSVAVRLSPRDEDVGRAYREVAHELAEERRRARESAAFGRERR